MIVFDNCGKSGVVVLDFDNDKSVKIPFKYKMFISVTYYKDESSSSSDNASPMITHTENEGQRKCKSSLLSAASDKLGLEIAENQDRSDLEMYLNNYNIHDFDETNSIDFTDIVTEPGNINLSITKGGNNMLQKNTIENKHYFGKDKDGENDVQNCFQNHITNVESHQEGFMLKKKNLKQNGNEVLASHNETRRNSLTLIDSEISESNGGGMLSNLSCQICKNGFQTNEELVKHGSIFISGEKCLICQKNFVSKANLLLHDYLSHECSEKMCSDCPVCHASFLDNLEVVNHLKFKHTNEAVYRCCVCSNVFYDYHVFKRHINDFRLNKVCNKTRKSKSQSLPEKSKEGPQHFQKIRDCSVVVPKLSKTTIKKHTKGIVLPKPPEHNLKRIDKDDSSFDSKLTKTIGWEMFKNEQGQLWYKCRICERLFRNKSALHNHVKQQSLVDMCKKCGSKAYSRAELIIHDYIRHSEEYQSDKVQGLDGFKCPACKEIYTSQDILVHVMSQHTDECPYFCCICGIPIENEEFYVQHVQSHQNTSPVTISDSHSNDLCLCLSFKNTSNDDKLVCRLCKKQFKNHKDFIRHCQNETSIKVCGICETTTLTEAGRIVHMYLSHGLSAEENQSPPIPSSHDSTIRNVWEEDVFYDYKDEYPENIKCPCCPDFVNINDILFHVMKVHSQELPFKCCACGGKSPNTVDYIDHCNFHLGKTIYDSESAQCNRCNLRFESRLAVTQHQDIWHKRFACSICQINFANNLLLEEHLQSRHQNEAKSCSFCGKLFTDAVSLAWHERNHYYRKKVSCTVCGEELSSKRALDSHMQAKHLNDLSHLLVLCTICGKMFAKRGLSAHKATHSNESPHDCSICKKSFKLRKSVQRHIARVHMKHIKCFICDVCGKKCATRSNLKIHMRIHSNVKAFSCNFCGQGFNYNQSLQAHISKKHKSGT